MARLPHKNNKQQIKIKIQLNQYYSWHHRINHNHYSNKSWWLL